jgi:hypothetical protein
MASFAPFLPFSSSVWKVARQILREVGGLKDLLKQSPAFLDGLYSKLVENGIRYFFPGARLQAIDPGSQPDARDNSVASSVILDSLGIEYALVRSAPLTESELKLAQSISGVLNARYRVMMDASRAEQPFELFRGLPEDRYVAAYIDDAPYRSEVWKGPDRVEDAIEVLRTSSLSTYENRRISTGALLFGTAPDPCHAAPVTPPGSLRYSPALTSIRSFYRLCDGLQTLALVDRDGCLVEIIDVEQWAEPYAEFELPVPSSARYRTHSRATLCGGHVCMILTPNGEMKIFANGVQVFRFLDGQWKLTDAEQKYGIWRRAIGNDELSERLFVAALDLADDRRGGLLVVLDNPASAQHLVSPTDLISSSPIYHGQTVSSSKDQLHYLLHQKRVLDLPTAVLETVARIDGSIVLDRDSNLLAFGAILRYPDLTEMHPDNIEGGRTTAAIAASRFGSVLKVSEDGLISLYQNGNCVWDM